MSEEVVVNETMSFADVLREMDIEFIVAGDYGITVEDALKLLHKDHFFSSMCEPGKKGSISLSHLHCTYPLMSYQIDYESCLGTSSS